MTRLCACGCGQTAGRWGLSLSCANALAGMCLGKTRFRTQYVAKRRRRGPQETYRCPVCAYLHNGAPVINDWLFWKRERVLEGLTARGKSGLLVLLAAGFEGMDRMEWKQNGWKGTP